jgi:hypothetical protein
MELSRKVTGSDLGPIGTLGCSGNNGVKEKVGDSWWHIQR